MGFATAEHGRPGMMPDRGEDLAEIARLAGIDAKTVRDLIRIVKQKPELPTDGRGSQ